MPPKAAGIRANFNTRLGIDLPKDPKEIERTAGTLCIEFDPKGQDLLLTTL
jgi:hypothetical protein